MQTETESALKVIGLKGENFKRFEAFHMEPNGQHVLVTGQNGSGKTTVLDAIWAALGGMKASKMPEPIRRGAKKASLRLDLGQFVVEKTWSESGPRLVVTGADGSKITQPQKLLDGLVGEFSIDPVAFLRIRPQDQVDSVLFIAGVKPPVAEVKEATGELHATREGESADSYLMRLSGDETGTYYVRRREKNREVDQKRGALEEARTELTKLGGPLAADEARSSATELLSRLERLQQQDEDRRNAIGEANRLADQHAEAGRKLSGLKAERAELDAKIRRLLEEKELLSGRIDKGEGVCTDLAGDLAAAQLYAKSLPDPAAEIGALKLKLATIEQTNKTQATRRLAQAQADRLAGEVEKTQAEHAKLDGIVERLRYIRLHLLDGIDLGVPGLEVGQGELRLDGVTFRQASQAQQIRVACAVAMRQAPKLRLLRIDDGEHLDAESKRLLLELANEAGFQVIMTCVKDEGPLQVEIVEAGDA